jgi:hypothetical protein
MFDIHFLNEKGDGLYTSPFLFYFFFISFYELEHQQLDKQYRSHL